MRTLPLFLLLLVLAPIGGCGQLAPSGNESAVKAQVIEVCLTLIRNRLLRNVVAKDNYLGYAMAGGDNASFEYDVLKSNADAAKNDPTKAEQLEQWKKWLNKVDDQMNGAHLSLEGIRIVESNDKTKKVKCVAELQVVLHDETDRLNIEYTAQYTEDDKLYVEVKFVN